MTLTCRWKCMECPAGGTGTWNDVDKAAERHTENGDL